MTTLTNSASYLNSPPIYDKFLDEDGNMTPPWVNWMNAINEAMGYVVVHDVLAQNYSAGPPVIQNRRDAVAVLNAPSFTEPERDILQSARDGTIIYNLTTDRFNFREAGSWVTFTAVPA